MGSDAVQPFLTVAEEEDKSLFVLVRTSNPSAVDLQDQEIAGRRHGLHGLMGDLVEQWGEGSRSAKYGYQPGGCCYRGHLPGGACTSSAQQMPHTFFLVPGYGAQGGTGRGRGQYAFHAGMAREPSSTPPAASSAPGRRPGQNGAGLPGGRPRRRRIAMRDDICAYTTIGD